MGAGIFLIKSSARMISYRARHVVRCRSAARSSSKVGRIERNVPQNTKLAREEALKSWEFLTKEGSVEGRLIVAIVSQNSFVLLLLHNYLENAREGCKSPCPSGGGAKHHFSQAPLLTISSGLGRLEGGICSTICTLLGEKYVLHPPWRSLHYHTVRCKMWHRTDLPFVKPST